MKKRLVLGVSSLLLVAAILGGCTWFGPKGLVGPMSEEASLNEYILVFDGLSDSLDAEVAALGGTVERVIAEIGVVLVSAPESFRVAAEGLTEFVVSIPNVSVDWIPDDEQIVVAEDVTPGDEPLYPYQWNLKAISAPDAWEAGYTGDGVLVAVLDSGIDYTHPDLAPNYVGGIDLAYGDDDPFDGDGHGTHVSGTIAAADNAFGVIGVAPEAQILAVKVLDDAGSGSFFDIWDGIVYATLMDADVINLSIGAWLPKSGWFEPEVHVTPSEFNWYISLTRQVINYATQQGVLVVCSAGNEAADGTGDAGWVHLPSDVGAGLVISATGPFGWGDDPTADLDRMAHYTNYGPQVDFAAPGGDWIYPGPTWYLDMVLSCFPGGWAWGAGTSMAAPHVCGVAALIIEANGGEMKPANIVRILRQSADDLGKRGQDPYYGYGRINAAQAVAP